MKRPSQAIQELVVENLEKLKENQRFNFGNIDKYMIWVVGFAIGGISIIATNLVDLTKIFSHSTIKTAFVLLSISLISGLVYRWFLYLYQVQYQNGEMYLQSAFSDKEIMELDETAIDKETDFFEITRRLSIDFGEDVSKVQQIYPTLNENMKDLLALDLKNHYRKLAQWAKKDYELGLKYIKDVLKDAFGYSDNQIDKFFSAQGNNKIQLYGKIVNISFLITCLSFIAVIVILCVKY